MLNEDNCKTIILYPENSLVTEDKIKCLMQTYILLISVTSRIILKNILKGILRQKEHDLGQDREMQKKGDEQKR